MWYYAPIIDTYIKEKHDAYISVVGDRPAMVDYMIWPFFERLPVVYEISAELHPKLTTWCNKMRDLPAVKKLAISNESFKKFYAGYATGNVDYDIAA